MNSSKYQRTLLIGGGGFIGQHLARACHDANMFVRIADTVPPSDVLNSPNIEYIQGDYRDPEYLYRIIDKIDYIIHLVHDKILLDVDCRMSLELERNIHPAIQLMDICSKVKISKLLFVSSGGTIYGHSFESVPILEDAPTRPISVYGTSKLMIENIGFLYKAQKNLPFIVARPGNAYGQGQIPFKGQGFISTAFASAKMGKTLSIYGDGTVIRDYIHVSDIAKALVALLQSGRVGEVYNIGTSSGTSLLDLIDNYIQPIISEDGIKLKCRYESARCADVQYNVLSNKKLLYDTGFNPLIELNNGIRDTWKWIKNNSYESIKLQRVDC
jgi:UDP-glucose 4-epimerase